MTTVFRSGDALMAFAPDLRVDTWNDGLESLTGIPAGEAIGRPCWEVLGGLDEQRRWSAIPAAQRLGSRARAGPFRRAES